MRSLFALFALTLLTSCGVESPADRYAQDAEAVKRGKSIFIGTCMGYCHSLKPSRREAPNLFDCNWRHGGTDQQVFTTISNGVPATNMVNYGGRLPEGEQDIWKIIAFLKTQRSSC